MQEPQPLTAFAINDSGEVAGFGVQLSSGKGHGITVTPGTADAQNFPNAQVQFTTVGT